MAHFSSAGSGIGIGLALSALLMTGCTVHTAETKVKGAAYTETTPQLPPGTRAKISRYSPLQMILPFVKKHGDKLTRDEFREDLREKFRKADKDHDGVLNKKEMRAVNNALWEQYGAGTTPLQDWNNDGGIDFEEFGSAAWSLFTLVDRNHDNVLTLKEIDPVLVRRRKHPHNPDRKPPPPQAASPRN